MTRKIILMIAFIVVFAPSSLFCQETSRLRLGILPVIDTLPLFVADEKGLFSKNNLDVVLVPFNSAIERDAALVSGKLDGYFGDLISVTLLNNSGQDLRVVTQSYHTNSTCRMFALLAGPKSGINSITQIENVNIAISEASIIEYFLDEMISKEKIDSSGIKKMGVRAIPIRYQMLMANNIKLALLPEPLVSKAVAGGAVVIADDRNLDTTATIIAIKERILRKNPEIGQRFLDAYSESVKMINSEPSSFKDILVNKTRFPASLKDKYRLPPFPDAVLPTPDDINRVEQWLLEKGLISERLSYDKIVWTK